MALRKTVHLRGGSLLTIDHVLRRSPSENQSDFKVVLKRVGDVSSLRSCQPMSHHQHTWLPTKIFSARADPEVEVRYIGFQEPSKFLFPVSFIFLTLTPCIYPRGSYPRGPLKAAHRNHLKFHRRVLQSQVEH